MTSVALHLDHSSRATAGARESDITSCAHSLFQQPWWLDAVAPGAWDAVVATGDGEVVGRLPFVRTRRFGLTTLTQPPLTPFLGPWVNAGAGKYHTRLAREHEILTSLIDALPDHDAFVQNCRYSVTNCLPFYWRGFSLTTNYTYMLTDLDDHDKIWVGFRENIRREIRKAERQVSVCTLEDIDTFIVLNRMTFERQGRSPPYSADLVRRIDAACKARGARRMFFAQGTDGAPHAALYLVWDHASAYYLMSGSHPLRRSSGAMSLLMWEAIKYAGQLTQRFDFEGSMLQPVERFFRAFGARQVQCTGLTRGFTLKGRLALLARELHAGVNTKPNTISSGANTHKGFRMKADRIPVDLSSGFHRSTQQRAAPGGNDFTSCAHCLFQQPWWLDALAPGAWDAVVVVKDGEIVGRLPFVRIRRFGLTILAQPPLTPSLGPWVKAGTGKIHTRLEREHEILGSLIAALPEHDVFVQRFDHSMTNCLQFYWHGFSQLVRYTYVLDDLEDHGKIWAGLRDKTRNEIRKAERQVSVRPLEDVNTFIALNRMTFGRHGMSLPYPADLVRRIDAACSVRGARRMFLAEGADGAPHAVLYLVWDHASAYYLMSGSDPRLRSSGAMSLLVWEAIKYASQVTRRFDFEGSMLQPVERFFRAFGARQVCYARIARGSTLKGQVALLAYDLRGARERRSA
jgi:lipid II:glycine glycyltransferase (peptidoglycan interpeptide bridge formation enzyme)